MGVLRVGRSTVISPPFIADPVPNQQLIHDRLLKARCELAE